MKAIICWLVGHVPDEPPADALHLSHAWTATMFGSWEERFTVWTCRRCPNVLYTQRVVSHARPAESGGTGDD